jgi:hypothetical protein
MNPDHAQDWLNLMIEVSVGVYVFFISVPALLYTTFIPQELRELKGYSANRMHARSFGSPPRLTISVVACGIVHFLIIHLIPQQLQSLENWWMPPLYYPENSEPTYFFSFLAALSSTFFFSLLLLSVNWSVKQMRPGYLKVIAQCITDDLIKSYRAPAHKRKHAATDDFWKDLEKLGKYTRPGQQKEIWLKCMNDIIMHFAEKRNDIEGLRRAIKTLAKTMDDAIDTATYDNIQVTLNIYRNLLNELSKTAQDGRDDSLADCYGEISNSLLKLTEHALAKELSSLVPSIISMLTLIPNNSSRLFDVSLIALRRQKYEVLVYAFSEIVSKGNKDEARIHNFWGIYAALYLKGGAFHDHAKRMRQQAEIPTMTNKVLKAAYDYHFSNADFDIADGLYKLISRQEKKPA